MKKKYIAPQVKEVRIELQQMISTSPTIGVGDTPGPVDAEGKNEWVGFEEWSFDEF